MMVACELKQSKLISKGAAGEARAGPRNGDDGWRGRRWAALLAGALEQAHGPAAADLHIDGGRRRPSQLAVPVEGRGVPALRLTRAGPKPQPWRARGGGRGRVPRARR